MYEFNPAVFHNKATESKQDEQIKLLQGVATAASGNASSANQDTQIDLAKKDVWNTIPGNSIIFTYYTGIVGGNPSGSVDNVEKAEYKEGAAIIFTQTFTYNSTNNVLSIIVT